ncbi:hypothetical protein DL98DRAFT_626411 [Cadophora sp. DSE1049]|nr:hypothetical protein DL98DRAFT_626411 [Cadophora sp. DSE1049]
MSNDRRHSDNFNSFNFSSSRATPKESRPRPRHSDRSRSPQRDRYPSGRYDRNEGEQHESERSGYDSYKPGQSPSRDMIPAPVRKSSTSSPFSTQIPSPLNDSWRQTSVRSPSDSSPYRQPDRPVISRTNTASSEQPSRSPEVGSSILGRAAKADEERKQREEEAKIYKAKAAQQKAVVPEQNSSTMEIVPPSRAPVESTGLSWKDKAEATEGGPTQDAASSTNSNSFAKAQLFVDSMGNVIDEMSELSSLKSRVKKCKAKLDRAVAEFEKSKDHHEKFPAIKDPQVQAKKAVDREYRKAVKELEQKEASLRQVAIQVTEKALPSILGSSSTQEHQQTKDRIDTVEKTCEKTCQKFENLLREQKAYFEAQQLKANQQWERSQKELKEGIRLLQAEIAKERPRTDKLFSRQNEFATITQNVSRELGLAKETIARFDVPKDLTQQLQKLNVLDQLRADIKACDTRSAITETGLTTLTATVTDVTHSVGTLDRTSKARDNVAQTLTEEQNKLRGTISEIDNRVKAVEDNTALERLEDRMSGLERAAPPATTSQSAGDQGNIERQLKALEAQLHPVTSHLSSFKEMEGFKTKVNKLDSTLSNAMDRISKVEEQAKVLEGVQKTESTDAKHTSPDFTALETRLAGSGAPNPSIENRISALEQERKRQTGLAGQSSVTAEEFNSLSNQVLQLNSAVASVEGDIASLVESTGGTVETYVNHHLQPIMNRVFTVESSLQTLENSRGSLQASLKTLQDSSVSLQASFKTLEDSYASIQTSIKASQESRLAIDNQIQSQNRTISDAKSSMVGAAAGSAIEIIRSQNMYAPASLDEKFTTALHQLSTNLMEHVEAQSLATGNLQYRMDNLNTGELHRAIVDNVGQAFPNLRNFDMAVQNLNSQMSTAGINMRAIQTQIAELQESRQAPAPAPAPTPSPAPASRQDDAIVKALRAEVDAHTLDLHRLKKLDKDIATISASLAGANKAIGELTEELAGRVFDLQSSGEDLDGKLGSLSDKVKGIDEKVDGVIQKQQQQQQQPSRAPSAMPRATFSNSRQTSTSTSTHRQPSVASTNRQPSVSSDTSSVLGKRKVQQMNGTGGSGAESPRKPTNGFKHGGENVRGSPNSKRPRRNKVEDDPEMDPDYEEGDPQPGISADEDEDE